MISISYEENLFPLYELYFAKNHNNDIIMVMRCADEVYYFHDVNDIATSGIESFAREYTLLSPVKSLKAA